MADIFVGSVAVGVVPDARGWERKLRAELVPSSSRIGEEVGTTMSKPIVDNMGKSGTKSADAFDKNFRQRLKAALEALPEAKINANSTEADKKVAALRKRMEDLLGKEIGVDLSAKEALKELALIDTGLEEVRKKSKDIPLTFDTKRARAQLALLRRDTGSAGGGGPVSALGGLFGGAGSVVPAAGAGAPAAAQGGGALAALTGPAGIVAALAAAIAALPFIAQAAAGGIVAALGGAFVGIGIAGAIMSGKLKKQWSDFTDHAKKDLVTIGAAFVPVLSHILHTAQTVLDKLTPVLSSIMRTIAGPFQLFVDTILKAFLNPAVQQSMKDVSKAFTDILTAFTPDIPGIAKSLAEAISALAREISKNPKAFADFLNFLFQIVIFTIRAITFLTAVANYIEMHFLPALHRIAVAWDIMRHEIAHIWDLIFENSIGMVIRLTHNVETQFNSMRHEIAVIFDGIRHEIAHVWDQIYDNSIGAVIRIWQKTNTPFANMRHSIAGHFDGIRHDIAHYWDLIFQDTIGRVIRLAHNVEVLLDGLRHKIAGIYDNIRHDISSIWDTIWNNTVGRAVNGANTLLGVFSGIRNRITSVFSRARNWLVDAGKNVIFGLMDGIISVMSGIGNWVYDNIVGPIVGAVKHFFGISSPSTVMMPIGSNLVQGMIKGILASARDLSHLIGMIFGGWPEALGHIVNKALIAIAGLPGKAVDALKSVAGKVGGFVGRTFAAPAKAIAHAVAPVSPIPGIISGIRGLAGLAGHIFDDGGWLPPGASMAYNFTGRPEYLTPVTAGGRAGSGTEYHAHFDGLTGAAIEAHVRTAFQAMSIQSGNLHRQGRRS